ncbi:MAG TPA: ATP-grasp domain-containing protein [Patescibacteria group bacterium]|nr:ATP-grasp domain-containing protein [Patescibacteria group bacterium]
MNKLDLVIFTQYPLSYAPTRLKDEAKKLGLKVKIFDYKKVKNVNNLPSSKYLILREPDAKNNIYHLRDDILNHYLLRTTKILNYKSYLKWSVLDKFLQHKEFKKANIPHIKLLKLKNTKYPFIVKAKLGSHGSQVFKITKTEELEKVLVNFKKEDLLVQEFQSSGFDLRVIVLDGSILGIMKRTPRKGQFLSNYSQGGIVTKYLGKDKDKIKTIAIKTARHFKLDYVGVDLMKGNDGKWKVLEVNRACQFHGFEKAIGVNVAQKLINWCILQGIHEKDISFSRQDKFKQEKTS